MAGTITHEWNGTVLTITSDAGTSSADLQGAAGDIGPRGPQGPAGVVVGGEGSGGTTADLTDYYTKSEVDALIPDVSGYATDDDVAEAVSGLATETFVTTKIAEAELSGGDGGSVDLSGYLPKDGSVPMTGRLIIQSPDGLWLDDTGSDANLYMNFDRSHNCAAIYSDGDIAFTTFNKRIIGVANPVDNTDVANKSYVDTAITNALAALDGDGVSY